MTVFLCGALFGAILASAGIVILFQRTQAARQEREIREWTDAHYQPPVVTNVTHHSINRIREINL